MIDSLKALNAFYAPLNAYLVCLLHRDVKRVRKDICHTLSILPTFPHDPPSGLSMIVVSKRFCFHDVHYNGTSADNQLICPEPTGSEPEGMSVCLLSSRQSLATDPSMSRSERIAFVLAIQRRPCPKTPSHRPYLANQAATESSRAPGLLGCALDTFGVWLTILIVLVHSAAIAKGSSSGVGVRILEVSRLGHSLSRRNVVDIGRRQDLAKSLEGLGVLCPVLLGEFDGEPDVQVAAIVVAIRRHTLATNHLDSVYIKVSMRQTRWRSAKYIPGAIASPGRMSTLSHLSSRCSI